MISRLHIENIAVIKSCDIEFSPGFNVLTGETGAGKSVLIGSLGLITGRKPKKDLIRFGETKAGVSAEFFGVDPPLPEGVPADEDGNLIVSRSFDQDGKVRSLINGKALPSAQFRASAEELISIHGQNDSLGLLTPSTHLDYLDSYGKSVGVRGEYEEIYASLSSLKRQIEELTRDSKEKARLADLYKLQLDEIDSAKLKAGEEEELISRLEKLKDSEKIVKHAGFVVKTLYRSEKGVPAAELIGRAASSVEAIKDYFPDADKYLNELEQIGFKLEEIALTADDLAHTGGDDPEAEMDRIQSRLDKISKLEKKYGDSVEEILAYRAETAKKYALITDTGEILGNLSRELAEVERKAKKKGTELSEMRKNAAADLQSRMIGELSYLEMPKVRFEARVNPSLDEKGEILYRPDGIDEAEFFFSANPGEELLPLAEVASGGELARVMLSLRSVNLSSSGGQTLVFDEIDTGVSGGTSQKIGMRLRRLAENNQVICVTHSAQIAAEADRHFLIKKSEVAGRTETSVTPLSRQGRTDEIARIMGGIKITEKILRSAEEMVAEAEKNRQ